MKLFINIILSTLLLSNSLKMSVIYGWYVMDIESFVTELCENKETPELKCNGKCYLTRIAVETVNPEEQNNIVLEWEQVLFCPTEIMLVETDAIVIFDDPKFHYTTTFTHVSSCSIFHPPQV